MVLLLQGFIKRWRATFTKNLRKNIIYENVTSLFISLLSFWLAI